MSKGFKIYKSGNGYFYLKDSKGGLEEKWSFLIYDMDRWALLELWWTVFWAWVKGKLGGRMNIFLIVNGYIVTAVGLTLIVMGVCCGR